MSYRFLLILVAICAILAGFAATVVKGSTPQGVERVYIAP